MFASVKSRWVAAVAAVLVTGGIANASPLINIQILGSYNGGAFTSNLSGLAGGSQVSFEIVGQISTIGTQNTHVTGGITSLTSADGIGSMSYNLTDSDGGVISALQLSSAFSQGSGFSAGTVSGSGNSLTGARPIEANGTFAGATSPSILETGTLTLGSLVTPETLSGVFGGTTSGARINGGTKSLVINSTTEASTDPYVGFSPLTISSVPEPTSLFSIGLLGASVGPRRRRSA